ncbi:DNL-type zinc finger protein [Asparagus officinalis]|uniref:DNL-type zinc finger protein n=1 Tax=Asparagus officinalis TaxID=4686 RepID=UPI00098E3171|nr:DNL-type zinc finger protein [Asparagus officinalis]
MAASSSRRLASLLFRNGPHLRIPRGYPLPFQSTTFLRGILTQNSPLCNTNENAEDTKPAPNSPESNPNVNNSIKFSASSSLKTSERHDLAMIFTCRVCETRSVKTVCRESYEKGVVLARCGGCNNVHLIADRLGWFGQPGSVEDFLAARGEEVTKGSSETLNLTLEDLVGKQSS